jgi:integrase
MDMFRAWYVKKRGPFALESDNLPREAHYHYYRCDCIFDSLVAWLRAQGVAGNKPFHTLRKLFGSLIAEKHGIFAASSALRHASIELTNQYYVDRTVRTTLGLGTVISGA